MTIAKFTDIIFEIRSEQGCFLSIMLKLFTLLIVTWTVVVAEKARFDNYRV